MVSDKRARPTATLGHIQYRSTQSACGYTANAAFIDDPDVISDKRLDSMLFSFLKAAAPSCHSGTTSILKHLMLIPV